MPVMHHGWRKVFLGRDCVGGTRKGGQTALNAPHDPPPPAKSGLSRLPPRASLQST